MSLSLKNNMARYSVLGGAMSLSLATIIVKLLGVLYKIPLANVLGDEGMGYFNSAYTVYAFFYLLCTAGVPKAIMILISEKFGDEREAHAQKVLQIAGRAFLLLGILVCLLFIVFSTPLSNFIGNSESRATMIAVAPSIIFVSLSGVLRGYLSSGMRMTVIAFSQIVEGVGKLAFGLIFARIAFVLKLPLSIISAMTILGVTLGSAFGFLFLYINSKNQKNENITGQSVKYNYKQTVLRILKISAPITASAALMSLSGIIDLTLIMRRLQEIGYTASEASALYGNYTTLAVSIFNLIISVITPISISFMPILTGAAATKNRKLFSDSLKSALEFSMIVCAPLMIGAVVYSEEILSLLFGNSGVETGAPLLSVLSGGVIFMTALLVTNSALESLGHGKGALFAMLAGSFVKIFVSNILLGNENYGISGAPLGTVISYGVSLVVSVLILSKITGEVVPLISTIYLPLLLGAVSVLSSRYLYDTFLRDFGTAALPLAIVICGVIYIIFLVALGTVSRNKIKMVAKYTNFG